MKQKYTTIDEYIQTFPPDIQKMLEQMRQAIRQAAPGATETISYQMPAFRLNGILVYFAAYKTHIGFYPTSSGIASFKQELGSYKSSKGAVQFPMDKALPLTLIKRIVAFRAKEDSQKTPRGKH